MRGLSPLLTIPTGAAQPSNGIEIGNQRIVGVVVESTGQTGATDIKIQEMVSGNLGQGNEVWRDITLVIPGTTATEANEPLALGAIAQGSYHINAEYSLTLGVVRLITVGTLATNAITARFILEPHK